MSLCRVLVSCPRVLSSCPVFPRVVFSCLQCPGGVSSCRVFVSRLHVVSCLCLRVVSSCRVFVSSLPVVSCLRFRVVSSSHVFVSYRVFVFVVLVSCVHVPSFFVMSRLCFRVRPCCQRPPRFLCRVFVSFLRLRVVSSSRVLVSRLRVVSSRRIFLAKLVTRVCVRVPGSHLLFLLSNVGREATTSHSPKAAHAE